MLLEDTVKELHTAAASSITQSFNAVWLITTLVAVVGTLPSAQLRQLNQLLSAVPTHSPLVPPGIDTLTVVVAVHLSASVMVTL